jgi:hypothetical protein
MATSRASSTVSSNANLPASLKEKEIEGPIPAQTPPGTPPPTDLEKTAEPVQQEPQPPTRQYGTVRWVLVCVAIYSSALLYGLDNTIVANVQAAVIETFGDVEKIGWLGIGFPLGSIATILSIGKAYSIFNMKWLYVGSLVMFAAGSALCGGANSLNALIVGRVWAGAGGAGVSKARSANLRIFY